ncbi:MAG TPA: hypothetical protein GX747_00890, partial [Tenericutes bacterium]|nr:hypothetical protein [Mycoplasmatota bacterium]
KSNSNTKLLLDISFIKTIENKSVFSTQKEENKIINNNLNVEKNTQDKDNKVKNKEEVIAMTDENEVKNEVLNQATNKKQLLFKKLKNIRIDNTLAKFDKRKLIQISKSIEEIKNMVLIPEYSYYASLLIDAQLKAASDEYLIFVYQDETSSNLFNENILIIENMIKKCLNSEYKVISTTLMEWEKIRNEFNNKLKNYVYKKENLDLNELFDENNDELKKIFGDIVEYK